MKVICIDASAGWISGILPPFKEGDILTAEQAPHPKDYVIIEVGEKRSWDKSRFIPLFDIDETELVNQKAETY